MKLLNMFIALLGTCLAQNASLQQGDTISTEGLVTNSSRYNTMLRVDNGTYGPPIEEVHYFYKYWPIGIAVSSKGRIFVSYTRGSYDWTAAEVVNMTAEKPYPSLGLQLPVNELNTTIAGISFGSSNASALISVQALYITKPTASRPETLWMLDTGRATIQDSAGTYTMPYAQPGGPKLIAVSLDNDTIYQIYTFPSTVYYPDSYFNDLRFDLRPSVNVVYLVDSSSEGRPGFIMLNLTDGTSWRRLTQHPSVLIDYGVVPSYQGHPFYYRNVGKGISSYPRPEGLDGIQLSKDGAYMYYSPLTSTQLYRIPTANLLALDSDPFAEQAASNNVSWLGQRGGQANGFEGDTNGLIYMLMPENNAIYYYDPNDLQTHGFVRDPRIIWPDGASVGEDGYIYMIINQLPYQDAWNDGVNLRELPGAILRARLNEGGRKNQID